ncbi:MAG: serine/threonine-protein kinase [Acidobacteriota bacterium]
MKRLQLPLLAKLVLALVLMGALPLGITLLQLRTQGDVLLDQVQRTHIVASGAAAERAAATVAGLRTLAETLAGHPAVVADAKSTAAQQLLRGTLQARSEVGAVGVYNDAGEAVILARRPGLEGDLPEVDGLSETLLSLLRGESGRPWLRLRQVLNGAEGHVVLLAQADGLAAAVGNQRLDTEATLVLAGRAEGVLLGGAPSDLELFPEELLEQAWSDKMASGARRYERRDADGGQGDLVTAFAQVEGTPWAVLSRQPAQAAQAAEERMRTVTWQAAALALGLTVLLAAGGFFTVVAPIRRLAAAQAKLVGGRVGGGSEIAQLESSFKLLQKRIRDSEDLGEIFLGRYQVTDLVGSGAMGSVFRGWDDKLRRPVALKTVHLDAETVDHGKLLAGLRDEAAITARIHQPNIVTVYDIEEQGTSAFIAMEFVDGVNLQKLLHVRRRLSEGEAIAIGAGVARGLAAAHAAGLVHHDVKPANILLGHDSSIKLTDFGVSQLISAATHARDTICGTPGYLAPECFEGGEYTPSSDLWAFGVVLYECIVGYNPFRGRQLRLSVARTMTVEPEPLAENHPSVPQSFSDLVVSLLEKDPEKRPNDAQRIAEQLEALAEDHGFTWRAELADVKTGSPPKRPKLDRDLGSSAPTQLVTIKDR